MSEWYVQNGLCKDGPISLSELQRMADDGFIDRHTKVCQSGGVWIAAAEVLDRFPPVEKRKPRPPPFKKSHSSVQWYYHADRKTLGPVSVSQLKELVRRGTVEPDTPVRQGEAGDWWAAANVEGLFPAVERLERPRRETNATQAPRNTVPTNQSPRHRPGHLTASQTIHNDATDARSIWTRPAVIRLSISALGGLCLTLLLSLIILAVRRTEQEPVEVSPSVAATDDETESESSSHIGRPLRLDSPRSTARHRAAELTPEEVFAIVSPSVARIEVYNQDLDRVGLGSGFVVSSEGLVVTNLHVVGSAYAAHVRFSDGKLYPVEGVAGVNEDIDLAILKIAAVPYEPLLLDNGKLPNVGTKTYAIGNPRGLTNSLSEGLVSGHRSRGSDVALIQTTAAISPGSSGGPLVSSSGRVLGVTTAFLASSQNLNFAVPAREVSTLIASRQPLIPLATAGSRPLDRNDSATLQSAVEAYQNQEYAKALRLLSQIREQVDGSAYYWSTLGFIHYALGNDAIAYDALQKSIDMGCEGASVHAAISAVCVRLGRYDESLRESQRAVALEPDNAEAYHALGVSYMRLEKSELAASAFRSAIALSPGRAEFHSALGFCHALSYRTKEAVESFRASLALDPRSAKAWYGLGMTYQSQGRYDTAVEALKKAIEHRTEQSAGDYYSLGRNLRLAGRFREATQPLQIALELDRTLAGVHLELFMVFENTAEYERAMTHLETCVRLDPDGSTGRKANNLLMLIREQQRSGLSLEQILSR